MRAFSEIAADTADCQLNLPDVNNTDLHVLRFHSKNMQLGRHYQLFIQTLNPDSLPDSLCSKTASLQITSDAPLIHGIITQLKSRCIGDNGWVSDLTLESMLASLKSAKRHRVFRDKTVIDIIKEIFSDYPAGNIDYRLAQQQDYPSLALTTQLNETDFDFLHRLLPQWGLYYGFAHTAASSQCVITDTLPLFSDNTALDFYPPTGQVPQSACLLHMSRTLSWLPNSFAVKDTIGDSTQFITAEAQSNSKVRGNGKYQQFGCNILSQQHAQQHVTIYRDYFDSQRNYFNARTTCSTLQPGQMLQVSHHPEYSGNYWIIGVDHFIDERNAVANEALDIALRYYNQIYLLPADSVFRDKPVYPVAPAGVIPAVIEANDPDKPLLDDQGRYRARFAFDRGNSSNTQATPPLTRLLPYGGPATDQYTYGAHFPLSDKTPIVLTHIHADLDRPLILGTLVTRKAATPVTSHNHTQHVFRSRQAHSWTIDDHPENSRMELSTRDQQNSLSMTGNPDNSQIHLQSATGDVELQSEKNMRFQSRAANSHSAGNNQSINVQGHHWLLTQQDDINIQSGKDLSVTTGQHLQMKSNKASVNINSGAELTLESQQNLSWHSDQGDITFEAPQGDVNIEAGGLTACSTEQFNFSNANAGISIDNNGALTFNAKSFTFNAPQIDIGQNICVNPAGSKPPA